VRRRRPRVRQMRTLSKRAVVGAVVVALVVVGAFGAYGYSMAGGSGSGTAAASAETVALVTLTPGTATTDLYPGMAGDVAVSIVNSNTYRAFVGSLGLDVDRGRNGFSVDARHSGCGVAALAYTTQSNGGAGWFVPAGSRLDLDLPNAVELDTGAGSECQGATFTIYLVAAR
jgi:hypothetical protein